MQLLKYANVHGLETIVILWLIRTGSRLVMCHYVLLMLGTVHSTIFLNEIRTKWHCSTTQERPGWNIHIYVKCVGARSLFTVSLVVCSMYSSVFPVTCHFISLYKQLIKQTLHNCITKYKYKEYLSGSFVLSALLHGSITFLHHNANKLDIH